MGFTPQFRVFAHLTTEKSPIYREVMGAFIDAKARFQLSLRPAEIGIVVATESDEALAA